MLVRDILGVCSFANVILDSKDDAFSLLIPFIFGIGERRIKAFFVGSGIVTLKRFSTTIILRF